MDMNLLGPFHKAHQAPFYPLQYLQIALVRGKDDTKIKFEKLLISESIRSSSHAHTFNMLEYSIMKSLLYQPSFPPILVPFSTKL